MTGAQRSLNYQEINLLLAAMDVVGARLQDFYQPKPEELILMLFHHGRRQPLLFCMSQKACRFHFLSSLPAKSPVRQRFVSFLYARAENAVIRGIEHIQNERILKITLEHGGIISLLWVRLWSSAPNIVYTDAEGKIGDALYRRPKKNEISGGRFDPERDFLTSPPRPPDPDKYRVREFGGDPQTALHERVEAYFRAVASVTLETGQREKLLNQLGVEENRLAASLAATDAWLREHASPERYKQFGDIIMSSFAAVKEGDEWLSAEDFFNDNAPIEIKLEPSLSPAENAESYYRKYKKTKATKERTEQERTELEQRLTALRAKIAEVEAADAEKLANLAKRTLKVKTPQAPKDVPGLAFESQGFVLYVGRSAKENDELYRRHVRGNDYWLHARDYPGASVFIKSRQAKSIPLDVLLDAGNLALFYSKAKNSARADLYYTQVKYLRKAGGKAGLFLPTQEKNLTVRLDETRIARLKSSAETFD